MALGSGEGGLWPVCCCVFCTNVSSGTSVSSAGMKRAMAPTMVLKATSIANTLQGNLFNNQVTAWFVPSVGVFIIVLVFIPRIFPRYLFHVYII